MVISDKCHHSARNLDVHITHGVEDGRRYCNGLAIKWISCKIALITVNRYKCFVRERKTASKRPLCEQT